MTLSYLGKFSCNPKDFFQTKRKISNSFTFKDIIPSSYILAFFISLRVVAHTFQWFQKNFSLESALPENSHPSNSPLVNPPLENSHPENPHPDYSYPCHYFEGIFKNSVSHLTLPFIHKRGDWVGVYTFPTPPERNCSPEWVVVFS